MFNKNSGLVQVWVRLIKYNMNYHLDMVPNISNLREVVSSIINEEVES